MEARITRLEDQFGRIEQLLNGLNERLQRLDDGVRAVEVSNAELKGRVGQLPSTWVMITTILGGQIALAGVVAAILKLAGAH